MTCRSLLIVLLFYFCTHSAWADEPVIVAFRFDDYYRTIAFVNALAFIAHREDHHPDLSVHYDRVVVRYSTHDVGGLSENDFICAAKATALTEE